MAYDYVVYSVYTCCSLGICLNFLLMFIAWRFSSRMGAFKYILMFFAFMEICYAAVVFVTQPVFYAYDYRLVVFSHSRFMAHSEYATIAAGLYCTFYEMWMGLVVILFMYKYVVLCKESWSFKVKNYWWPKLLIMVIYLSHVSYSVICGLVWCTSNKIPDEIKGQIKVIFNKDNDSTEYLGYMVLTLIDKENNFSVRGLIAVVDHFILVGLSGAIIIYCGKSIWGKITEMQNERNHNEYRRNIQIFYTLVLQATVPLMMYQIPTAVIMGDALIEQEPILTKFIPLWSLLMAMPKVIDPLIILMVIKEYRLALKRFVTEGKVHPVSTDDYEHRRSRTGPVHPSQTATHSQTHATEA